MADRITLTDLRRAFEAHSDALTKCGIVFEGRLILTEGSKYFGNAYRINVTDFPARCQNRRYVGDDGSSAEGFVDINGNHAHVDWDWDHEGCRDCHGTKIETCTGHNKPPIGDDYLGMTTREAYETLTERTRTIYDTAAAIEAGKPTND